MHYRNKKGTKESGLQRQKQNSSCRKQMSMQQQSKRQMIQREQHHHHQQLLLLTLKTKPVPAAARNEASSNRAHPSGTATSADGSKGKVPAAAPAAAQAQKTVKLPVQLLAKLTENPAASRPCPCSRLAVACESASFAVGMSVEIIVKKPGATGQAVYEVVGEDTVNTTGAALDPINNYKLLAYHVALEEVKVLEGKKDLLKAANLWHTMEEKGIYKGVTSLWDVCNRLSRKAADGVTLLPVHMCQLPACKLR